MRYAVFSLWPPQNEADLVGVAWSKAAALALAEHWQEQGFDISVRMVTKAVNLKLPEFQFIAMPGRQILQLLRKEGGAQ